MESPLNSRKKYIKELFLKYRDFMKAPDWNKMPNYEDWKSDQEKGINQPPFQKSYPSNAELIDLVPSQEFFGHEFALSLTEAIRNRKSCRKFSDDNLTFRELSYLLWATQGVRKIAVDKRHGDSIEVVRKVVPSGGSRHPFETYLIINKVDNLKKGLYRYLSLDHKLHLIKELEGIISDKLVKLTNNQQFTSKSAVLFIWAVIPYRTEWRYSLISYKDILIEAGHICQNLYLACEIINSGTCAILSYDQKAIDELLELDGIDEFVIYIAPVGKKKVQG